MLHLCFFGRAGTDHRLFNLTCRILKHFQILVHGSNNSHAARLPKLERRIRVFRHKHLFNSEKVWFKLGNDFTDARINQL
ncbi:hypothetical protein D3C78_1837930 [compost metagenome]